MPGSALERSEGVGVVMLGMPVHVRSDGIALGWTHIVGKKSHVFAIRIDGLESPVIFSPHASVVGPISLLVLCLRLEEVHSQKGRSIGNWIKIRLLKWATCFELPIDAFKRY